MARGFFRVYRTYNYIDKNPVIDKVRTLVQDEGLIGNLDAMHEISGVSTTTLRSWFFGETRNPQHGTIAAVITSLGYEEQFVKARSIDIAAERKAGHDWLEKRAKQKQKAEPKTKPNGHGRKK